MTATYWLYGLLGREWERASVSAKVLSLDSSELLSRCFSASGSRDRLSVKIAAAWVRYIENLGLYSTHTISGRSSALTRHDINRSGHSASGFRHPPLFLSHSCLL